MSAPVTIVVDMLPIAKARARLGNHGVYTPSATRAYERSVAWFAKICMRNKRPFAGPVRLEIVFELPPPRDWLKPRRGRDVAFNQHAIRKPDIDNLIKAALDAINNIVVDDDAQIVQLLAKKVFSSTPRIVITAVPLEDEGGPP